MDLRLPAASYGDCARYCGSKNAQKRSILGKPEISTGLRVHRKLQNSFSGTYQLTVF